MVYCNFCVKNVDTQYMDGMICCSRCGKVLNEDNFSNEPTFIKNATGQSQFSGNYVKTVPSDYSVSRERILKRASDSMYSMLSSLNLTDKHDSIVRPALAFYTIAVERNFTRGRRKELVEAACLYLACRENKQPFLLIDFSEYLNINVYVLGAVFLQLCKLLSLEEHPVVQKPVDPSLFIHRFANSLVGQDYKGVAKTALLIIASMKRDWIQTGRKPSGLCGAALYISALSHGQKYTKSHIVRVVHICEATLTRRLIEFESTESGSLTIEEFNRKAEELKRESSSTKQPHTGLNSSGTSGLLCEHKDSGNSAFAHGLCKSCYDVFVELSGGLEGGSEPPAFQRAEQERMAKESAEENAHNSSPVTMVSQKQNNSKYLNLEKELDVLEANRNEKLQPAETGSIGAATNYAAMDNGAFDKFPKVDGTSTKACDESESLSDIDDFEVDGYIHNEEEKHYKKIIWEEMNREYIEEQAAKEAAAAAAKEAYEANFRNCPDDMQAAQELAAAAAAAVAKSRKERQQKRAAEARNSAPAQTAAEATRQMLTKKRLSSKINYDVLDKLFDESDALENPKKNRTEPGSGNAHVLDDSKKELESAEGHNNGMLVSEDENDDAGDIAGGYAGDVYDENPEEGYVYDDDYGFDGY